MRTGKPSMKCFQTFRKALPHIQRNLTTTDHPQINHFPPLLRHAKTITQRRQYKFPLRFRRPYSTDPKKPSYNPTPHLNSPPASLSLSQRLRKLSREYGWSAFGVYLLLTALDFPFCFATVRYLGTDRIGHYEHVIVEWVKSVVPETVKARWREMRERPKTPVVDDGERGSTTVGGVAGEGMKVEGYGVVKGEKEIAVVPGYDHGVQEAEKLNQSENASEWSFSGLDVTKRTFLTARW